MTKDKCMTGKVAIVGKSPLFPFVSEEKKFWPALIATDGLIGGIATGEWPFKELISEEKLEKIKSYFMSSGLLSSGKLPENGFEIPADVLKISEAMPALFMHLAKKSLDDTKSYIQNKINSGKVKLAVFSFADNDIFNNLKIPTICGIMKFAGVPSEKLAEIKKELQLNNTDTLKQTLIQKVKEKFGFESMNKDSSSSFTCLTSVIKAAATELQSGLTDMVIVGGVNSVNALHSYVKSSARTLEQKLTDGFGFLTLRRFDDAIRDNDTVYAVISGVKNNEVSFEEQSHPIEKCAEISSTELEVPDTLEDFIKSGSGNYPRPLSSIGKLSSDKKSEFFNNKRFVNGAFLSEVNTDNTSLNRNEASEIPWLAEFIEKNYLDSNNVDNAYQKLVCSEHVARFTRLHSSTVDFDSTDKLCKHLPLNKLLVDYSEQNDIITATGTIAEMLNWKGLRHRWASLTNSHRFFHDLLAILSGTFIHKVVIEAPDELDKVSSEPVIYLANHQIGIESPLFMALSYALTGVSIEAVAKPEHVNTWLAFLMAFAEDSLGSDHPFKLAYFDKTNPLELITSLRQKSQWNSSLLVHVEGTRDTEAGRPVRKMSSVFLDLAIEKNIPIVPIRFVGGLPMNNESSKKLDFPHNYGRQDYYIGKPILPKNLKKLFYGQRPKYIMERINNLGPLNDEDTTIPPVTKFIEKQKFLVNNLGLPQIQAMLFAMLGLIDDPCEETAKLLKAVKSGKLDIDVADISPALKKFMTHVNAK